MITKVQYEALSLRMEELLKETNGIDNIEDPKMIALDYISDQIADYEEVYYPIQKPSLVEVLKLKMYEQDLTQKALSEMLEVSTSRVSEYMNEKCKPTLSVARKISKTLNIDASILLGI